jgi:hypothetical protein
MSTGGGAGPFSESMTWGAQYRALQVQELVLESPGNAPWGECFFHLSDPGGHELSFAIAGG